MPAKVFDISFPKTGTTSLFFAMKALGYRTTPEPSTFIEECSLPWNERPALSRDVFEKWMAGRYDFQAVGRYDFLCSCFFPIFKEMDAQFPGNKFILLVRDPQTWMRSVRAFAPGRFDVDLSRPREMDLLTLIRMMMLGSYDTSDEQKYMDIYLEHRRRVQEHFRGTGRLLVLDLCGGEGWEKLCPFLGVDDPGVPFPWQNRTPGLPPPAEGEDRDPSGAEDVLQTMSRRPGGTRRRAGDEERFSLELDRTTLADRVGEIAKLASACGEQGHEMHIRSVELVSLDDRDLARLTGSESPSTDRVLEAARKLREDPVTSSVMEGSVAILRPFHPWQGPEGIRRNLQVILEEGLARIFGRVEMGQMDLRAGTAPFHRAVKEGLVDPDWLDGGDSRRSGEGCLPGRGWRFQNPVMDTIHGLWQPLGGRIPDGPGLLGACLDAVDRGATAGPDAPDRVALVQRLHHRIRSWAPRSGHSRMVVGLGSLEEKASPWSLTAGVTFADGTRRVLARGLDRSSSAPTVPGPLPAVVQELRRAGAREVEVITHGQMLPPRLLVESVREAGVDMLTFQLFGHDDRTHDTLAGSPGAFEQTMATLNSLAGMRSRPGSTQIALLIVAAAPNARSLHAVPRLASELGVDEIRIAVGARGIDLVDPEGMGACIQGTLESAAQLCVPAHADVDLSFPWNPRQ